jgi:hypothetical protein
MRIETRPIKDSAEGDKSITIDLDDNIKSVWIRQGNRHINLALYSWTNVSIWDTAKRDIVVSYDHRIKITKSPF